MKRSTKSKPKTDAARPPTVLTLRNSLRVGFISGPFPPQRGPEDLGKAGSYIPSFGTCQAIPIVAAPPSVKWAPNLQRRGRFNLEFWALTEEQIQAIAAALKP